MSNGTFKDLVKDDIYLSLSELGAKCEYEYNSAKTYRNALIDLFNAFVQENLPDFDPEYDAGFQSATSMRKSTMTLEEFKRDIEDNVAGKKVTVWDFTLKHLENVYAMNKHYYTFKALESLIEEKLMKMSYNYF